MSTNAGPTRDLRLALWQTPYAPTPERALAALDGAAAQARSQGAELLVTPEMALTGYLVGPARAAALAEPPDGPLARAVARIARRHRIAIAYGYPRRNPGQRLGRNLGQNLGQGPGDGPQGKPFNATQLIGPDGRPLAGYDKTHLFGPADAAQFAPGQAAPAVLRWRGWRLGLLICYDVEFPETVRALALQGADAVLVPTANMREYDEVPRLLVPARACENRLYVAYANACGREADTAYGGLSTVAGPLGQVLVRAGRPRSLQVVSLSAAALRQARRSSPLPHRRADLYTLISH